jgi:hypothetical protein
MTMSNHQSSSKYGGCKLAALGLLTTVATTTSAFIVGPSRSETRSGLHMVAVDPSVISKKDYQDICGVEFDDQSLEQRLKRTSYLYPKHVEVIEDIAPIADAMVDEIVSTELSMSASITTSSFISTHSNTYI